MASDISLVLSSEHRDLLVLADRCGRTSRGLDDPVGDLHHRLQAHLAAADEVVHAVHGCLSSQAELDVQQAVGLVNAALGDEAVTGDVLAQAARGLVEAERTRVLPVLSTLLPIAERRHMGKVFRMRRDAALRSAHPRQHRQRSQTELYELARRAGLEHRSSMTQAELQAAVAQWERRSGQGMKATG